MGIEIKTLKQAKAGIVSFKIPNSENLLVKLEDKQIFIAERAGLFRVSPHFYNNQDDILHLVKAIKGM
ncbi:MAG: hypothetical protein ACK5LL_04960, partial [Suipraeoptans sp.]